VTKTLTEPHSSRDRRHVDLVEPGARRVEKTQPRAFSAVFLRESIADENVGLGKKIEDRLFVFLIAVDEFETVTE
jgi:hypothetical protein